MKRASCKITRTLGGALLAILALAAGVAPSLAAEKPPSLENGFRQPPHSARPWAYWFIMDGNLSREGITADFEALQRAGIGGVLVMEVDVGIPRGPVKFMSPEWRGLFKHAVLEAERLGLEITLNAGPGWTGSGGPWVKPEQSMQHIVASAVEVVGPTHFSAFLPRPSPRPPYFGNAGLPESILKAKDAFYMDVAVLAFPRPADTVRLADIDEKALYLRHPYSSSPGTKPFLPAPASYPVLPAEAVIATNRLVDLSVRLGPDGRLNWDVPEGRWTILRFGRTSTGANTRPAPAPGLGLECDKFDRAALEAHFDAFIGALLRELGPRRRPAGAGWTMLHIDSWEMGSQNWTAAFREEFRGRRGYDALPYLPVVTGRVVESQEVSERFLWDLRQTAQELVIENHAQYLKELGHRHGFGLSIEPYDLNPCADLSLGAVADVPMGEFWISPFNTTFSVIEAASIAHTWGRPVVAAESFTCDDTERWRAYPASMKTLGDWAFCAGINRIVFHRSQHQPWLDRWPGMTMGPYGVHWERTQTWWNMASAYHTYLARCQFLLRQGLPVADICYLAAEGAPHVFRPPPTATRGQPPDRLGYNFDGIAPDTFLARMSVKNGQLRLPDGMSYRVLVLPERETMTPGLLRKVKELVEAGATVIGPRPLKSPSLSGYPGCDTEVKRLADDLWGETRVPAPTGSIPEPPEGGTLSQHRLGLGRVLWDRSAQAGNRGSVLGSARWIWHKEGNPAASAPVGKRFFRRSFMLDEDAAIESARVFMTADNSFELWVNGQPAGSGDNFHQAVEMDVAPLLKPGLNALAVWAVNGGETPNPAGLIGNLAIRFRNGRLLEVPTDRQWQAPPDTDGTSTDRADAGDHWGPALELGPAGMSPWGLDGKSGREPAQYGDFAIPASVLRGLGLSPDFESDGPLRYTHRRAEAADIYFLANREEKPVQANAIFRVSGKAPELWDPITGETRALPDYRVKEGRTLVPLRFEPAQSFFIVFRKAAIAPKDPAQNFPATQTVLELNGSWEVAFDPKWGGPAMVTFDKLEDWSKRPEPGIRYYSGTAVYRTTFNWPSNSPLATRHSAIKLDLGAVKNLARARLNGQDLGVVRCAPWAMDVTAAVKERNNQLEITVANLWPNRLIGDQSLPPDKRLTWTTWNPFTKDSPLLESGLIGPVTVRALGGKP